MGASIINLKKTNIIYLLKLLVAICIILFLIYFIQIDEIIKILTEVDLSYLFAALALLTLNIFFQFKKWEILCNIVLSEFDRKKILKSLLIGIGAGMFTPMKSGEYFARSLELKESNVVNVTLATAADKAFTFITIFFIGGIVFIYSINEFVSNSIVLSYLSSFIFIVAMSFITLLIVFRERIKFNFKNKKKYKIIENLNEFLSSIKTLPVKVIIKTFLFAFFLLITICLQLLFLLTAFYGEFDMHFLQIAILTFFTQIFIPPLVLGEIGVRESAAVYLVDKIGINPAVGFNAAMFLFLINFIVPSVLTYFFF